MAMRRVKLIFAPCTFTDRETNMGLIEQLQKLQTLREQNALSEDEFTRAKQRVIDDAGRPAPRVAAAIDGLRRSWHDRWIAGVCGGLAAQTNVPTWAWRILFILTTFLHGIGALIYLLMWIFVPLDRPVLAALGSVKPVDPGSSEPR